MGIFSTILGGLFGGLGASSDAKADKEAIKLQGKEQRKTLAFGDKLEYFRNQQLRHERKRSLDSHYNQFSTVKNFAPFYKPGTGLDAMPEYPDAGDA